MMKRLPLALLGSLLFVAAGAQNLSPVQDSLGKLFVSVDARMELLGAAQLVSGYPLCTKNSSYSNRAKKYFGPFAESDAAKCTQKLLELGFCYDAPPAMMLRYSPSPELKQVKPYSDYLEERAEGKKNLEQYRKTLSEFARESRFADFWKDNQAYYRQLVDVFKREMEDVDIISLLENYYGIDGGNFHVILCPLFGQCNYGPSMPNAAGGEDIYALLCASAEKDGVPVATGNDHLELILHEFSHSFIGPITEKYSDRVMTSGRLFEPIKEQMAEQAYSNWRICVDEHIIRAVVIRILDRMGLAEQTGARLRYEQGQHFVYIEPLIAKLKEYEAKRDAEGITFADYMPTLLDALNEQETYVPRFIGPVNSVFSGPAVCVYPTVGDKAQAAADYAKKITAWLSSQPNRPERIIVSDSVALNMPLKDYNIVCYGTVESNLLLRKYASVLPFRVEDGVLHADRKYEDPAVKMITCIPNPENPELGMAIYTALDNSGIAGMNNVFHGPEDFYIFTDSEHILSHGFYLKKNQFWSFPEP